MPILTESDAVLDGEKLQDRIDKLDTPEEIAKRMYDRLRGSDPDVRAKVFILPEIRSISESFEMTEEEILAKRMYNTLVGGGPNQEQISYVSNKFDGRILVGTTAIGTPPKDRIGSMVLFQNGECGRVMGVLWGAYITYDVEPLTSTLPPKIGEHIIFFSHTHPENKQ